MVSVTIDLFLYSIPVAGPALKFRKGTYNVANEELGL
jgi:hypothetical protein